MNLRPFHLQPLEQSAHLTAQLAAPGAPPPTGFQPSSGLGETAWKLALLFVYLPLIPLLELEFHKNRTLFTSQFPVLSTW